MNYNTPHQNNGTITIRVMCAVVFVLYTFSWLYFFQADVLAASQHILSGGQTHYDRKIGAVIITGILCLVQLAVFALIRLIRRWHALTYFPSFLLLGLLTNVDEQFLRQLSWGTWHLVALLLLVVWAIASWSLYGYQSIENKVGMSKTVWVNLLLMALMMAGVGVVANTNNVFHYRMHMEVGLCEHDYDGVSACGEKSLETDESMLMLRMYALSQKNELGERLFEYTVRGSSTDILPLADSHSSTLLFPPDSIYRYLGAWPRGYMNAMQYVDAIIRHEQATPPAADYLLCGYLLDKDLDAFARNIGRFYEVNDSLPKHYREALILYTHSRSVPLVEYHHAVMDEDFSNLRQLENEFPLETERRGKVREKYSGTYWYYYDYASGN